MSYQPPQALGDVMEAVIGRLGIRKRLDVARTIEAWAEVAGPQINGVTDTAWVKGQKLYVRITSSVWRHELHLRRTAWRDRLNEHLGSDLVKEIIFC